MAYELSPQFVRLSELISTSPKDAWVGLVEFVAGGGQLLEAEALLEELVANNAPDFLDAIESEAAASDQFAEVVAYATVTEVGGPGIDRFHEIQRQVRDRLGVQSWQGLMPFSDHNPSPPPRVPGGASDTERDDDLHPLVKSDPERAWPIVLAFVRTHPELASAQDLVEDLVTSMTTSSSPGLRPPRWMTRSSARSSYRHMWVAWQAKVPNSSAIYRLGFCRS
jgi:hypothetical protein